MTIQELAHRANVTTRTIRYYVEQGILPPPGRGRPSEYNEEHLKVLDLVRRLKEQYLPLEEIRSMLQNLSMDQVEDFLRETTPGEQPAGELTNSAADYIAQVLNRGTMRTRLQQEAAPAAPAAPTTPAPPQWPSISEVTPSYGAPPPPTPAPGQASQPYFAEPASTPPPAAARAAPAAPVLANAEAQKRAVSSESAEQAETWQRVQLAPGIELHYHPPEDPGERGLVARIVQAARQILGQEKA